MRRRKRNVLGDPVMLRARRRSDLFVEALEPRTLLAHDIPHETFDVTKEYQCFVEAHGSRRIGKKIDRWCFNMLISFSTLKAVQSAAILLKEEGGEMTRLRLLKLLYIADRESIAETFQPITGDDVVAMDHGPVLSKTYRLIRREPQPGNAVWDKYIAQEGERNHVLIDQPGDGSLSEYEIRKLRAVSAVRRGMTDYEIADETHKFPEWSKNQPPEGGRKDIPLRDVLDALGMANYEERLVADEQAEGAFEDALTAVRKA